MFRNYLKTAFRNLFKNKVLSIINIVGLSFGMAGAVLLILNIQYAFSVDQFHQNKNEIFLAYNKDVMNGKVICYAETAAPLGPTLQKDYPEIRAVTRVAGTSSLLTWGDKKIQESGSFIDDPFLDMFSFPLVQGNKQTALNDPYSIVITQSLAKKLFGNEDAMNKIIKADNKDNFKVTGVLKDLPNNNTIKFAYLQPWKYQQAKGRDNLKWDNNFLRTYVQVKAVTNIDALNKKISDNFRRDRKDEPEPFLYSITKTYLYGRFENGKPADGNIRNMRFLGILAFVILLIACINFMNLSTARSEKRAKEVGVRKVMGAGKRSLVFQFIGESILLATIAGIIAFMIVQLILPTFSVFANIHPEIAYRSPIFWLAAAGFIIFTGLLAGSYPAFYLSSFKPVRVLKGVMKNAKALVAPRKVLVVLQFTIAILLINFTIVFRKQINHTEGRETGFVKENLVFHGMTADLKKNYTHIKNELISSGAAISVSTSNMAITKGGVTVSGLTWKGMEPGLNVGFELLSASGDFVTTNGLQLVAGRDIDMEKYPTDTGSCLINESTAKLLGFKEPLGQVLDDDGKRWTIVGVLKNFVYGPPNQAVQPVLVLGTRWNNFISIRLNSNNAMQHVLTAERILKQYNPNYITELQFADEDYARRFKEVKNASVLISSFALIAIFISCMGLFGLVTYMAELRTREIGIRKVLGSSVAGITSLLAKDFIKLVAIAIIIASPIAWFIMNAFLRSFSYRTTISWWILAGAGIGSLLIALLTISFQSIKAAKANPVKSLRTE